MASDYLMVAAIDFGTTYSGFAFSFRHEFQREPTKVSARTWDATSGGLQSLKTSTCILFKPDGTFHSFGFQAEDKYFTLAEDNEHHGWYFFRRFKMQLYNAKNVHNDFPLESDNGGTLPAIKVFSQSLRYLKDEMFKECHKQNADIEDTDVKWVLTVPAIWTDPAKGFMRAAAIKAGIDGNRLMMALEPEAAAMYVKNLPLTKKKEGILGDSFTTFGTGHKYLVLDTGGGTIDIAVHEVLHDGSVREITTANGGNLGGTRVDKSFQDFLEEIFGKDVFEQFSKAGKSDFLEIFRDFEVKKRTIHDKMDGKITIKIPAVLNETFQAFNKGKTIKEKNKSHKFAQDISFLSDKIRISPSVAKSFFEETITANISHLKQLFKREEVRNVESVLMVGGFSECPMLADRVKAASMGKRLIIPQDAGLVILKGAVLFGHDPSLIKERKSKYTYGIGMLIDFDPKVHPEERKITKANGDVLCGPIFSKHVEIDKSIPVGIPQFRKSYSSHEDDDECNIVVYYTLDTNPVYVTDKGCNTAARLTIPLSQSRSEEDIDVEFTFGGTEIEVKAVLESTGQEFTTHVPLDI